jgi:hypothetical protein
MVFIYGGRGGGGGNVEMEGGAISSSSLLTTSDHFNKRQTTPATSFIPSPKVKQLTLKRRVELKALGYKLYDEYTKY